MQYSAESEGIAYHLGVIEGQLTRRTFEENLVLALSLLRRAWTQFSGEFALSDDFGQAGNLLQTHARIERYLFLDFLAGCPWPPMRDAVALLERLFRALPDGEGDKVPGSWYVALAAAIEAIDATFGGSALERISSSVSALFQGHPAFSEGVGEAAVHTIDGKAVHSYHGPLPSAAWAYNLAAANMSKQLGLNSHGLPFPSLVRREVFRTDLSRDRRHSILTEILDLSARAVVNELDASSRVVRTALAELRRGRKHSRSADAFILLAGTGGLSIKQLSVLLGASHEGTRKIIAQLVGDGLAQALSGNTFAARLKPRSSDHAQTGWETSLLGPTPLARSFTYESADLQDSSPLDS